MSLEHPGTVDTWTPSQHYKRSEWRAFCFSFLPFPPAGLSSFPTLCDGLIHFMCLSVICQPLREVGCAGMGMILVLPSQTVLGTKEVVSESLLLEELNDWMTEYSRALEEERKQER